MTRSELRLVAIPGNPTLGDRPHIMTGQPRILS